MTSKYLHIPKKSPKVIFFKFVRNLKICYDTVLVRVFVFHENFGKNDLDNYFRNVSILKFRQTQ